MKKSRAYTIALAAMLLAGLLLTAVVYYAAERNQFKVWEYRAVAEAERMSNELIYRMELEREPLLSLATLYKGSREVTEEELRAAHDNLFSFTQSRNNMATGWYNAALQQFEQTSGNFAWPVTQELPTPINLAIEHSLNNGSNLYVAPLFQYETKSYLAMSVSVMNNGQEGALIVVIPFNDILMRVASDILDQGKSLSIFTTEQPLVNHAQLTPLATEAEAIHFMSLEFGGNTLNFRWALDADNSPLWQESNLGLFIIFVGITVTCLAVFAYGAVLFHNIRVETSVQQRTRQLKETYEGLQSANAKLVQQERLASLGKLVAGISHELSTPISNAYMGASLLDDVVNDLKQLESPPKSVTKLEETASLLKSSTQRATDLITSFKEVSIETTSTKPSHLALKDLVDEVITSLKTDIQKKNFSVSNTVDPSLYVEVFAGQLATVLTHLVQNALVHAYASRAEGRVDIYANEVDGNQVELCVEDFGEGMKPETMVRIYEPFFTTRLGQGGSGLGMHVVYNIVDAVLLGNIEVQSTEQKGTKFIIRFPKTRQTKEFR
ncbi:MULTISPECIES: sensor histidine kinase [Gammaproteobacteria]|uniref:sensor histidine kinase n=1 Tax=Gammaproteobacteria TaxID=1236 RepID=UPI000F7FC30F|nr:MULTISPECIES: HAMP domain-containing sensor histidine kinase [Gammaproteobacteria]RTE85881.1 HAMP domain-containing histidine kinase [Aliidiomarina sp. B3213]TCZ90118.1 HAMP domain-containing histidine kinase [Lysobacter sp. N42]